MTGAMALFEAYLAALTGKFPFAFNMPMAMRCKLVPGICPICFNFSFIAILGRQGNGSNAEAGLVLLS